MSTTFTIHGAVLEAMLNFVSTSTSVTCQQVLQDVLCEIAPDHIRLVATDTHVMGILHLTPTSGYDLDIKCTEPTEIVLPVAEMRSFLKRGRTAILTLEENFDVTVNVGGALSSFPGRPGADFPHYKRVIPTMPTIGVPRFGIDATLLNKFAAFAKALRVDASLDCAFHQSLGPISVRIKGVSSFYGVIMPRTLSYEDPLPDWLLPPKEQRVSLPERHAAFRP